MIKLNPYYLIIEINFKMNYFYFYFIKINLIFLKVIILIYLNSLIFLNIYLHKLKLVKHLY